MRDTYDLGDKLVIVTTDRQSAFDRLLAAVPFKGQVLNETSAWWMGQTQHIVKNALLAGGCALLSPDAVAAAARRQLSACGVAAFLDPLPALLCCLRRSPRRQRVHHAQVHRLPRGVCVQGIHDRCARR